MKIKHLFESEKPVTLVSSNQSKIAEFKKYIPTLNIEVGKDLPEVSGNANTVIVYKSLTAGKNYLVEDTILKVNGQEVVDIKWKKNELKENDKVQWIVSLGYNDGENIYVYRGITNGHITLQKENPKAFGFDDILIPAGSKLTLFELGNNKEKFSARKKALENFVKNKHIIKKPISTIKPWKGKYQNET